MGGTAASVCGQRDPYKISYPGHPYFQHELLPVDEEGMQEVDDLHGKILVEWFP